jgi:hypothetical protein
MHAALLERLPVRHADRLVQIYQTTGAGGEHFDFRIRSTSTCATTRPPSTASRRTCPCQSGSARMGQATASSPSS